MCERGNVRVIINLGFVHHLSYEYKIRVVYNSSCATQYLTKSELHFLCVTGTYDVTAYTVVACN